MAILHFYGYAVHRILFIVLNIVDQKQILRIDHLLLRQLLQRLVKVQRQTQQKRERQHQTDRKQMLFEIPSQLHGITSFHEEVPDSLAFHQYRTEGGKDLCVLHDIDLDIVGVGAVGGGKGAVKVCVDVLVRRTGGRVHVVQPQTEGFVADRVVPAA